MVVIFQKSAASRAARPIRCNVAIDRAEDRHRPGNSAEQPKRPEPPDVTHQNHRGIRAAQNLLLWELQAHLREGFVVCKVKPGFDPRGLQRDEFESMPE